MRIFTYHTHCHELQLVAQRTVCYSLLGYSWKRGEEQEISYQSSLILLCHVKPAIRTAPATHFLPRVSGTSVHSVSGRGGGQGQQASAWGVTS